MKQSRLLRLQTIGTILFALSVSAPDVMALERWLVPDTSQCADDITINPCHLTLDDAITQASGGDSIKILPGAYPANVTLSPSKNITIYGVETARTFLTGNGNTVITVNGVTAAMGIRNITFINASPAIQVSNGSSQVGIRNNIFEVTGSATAISVTDALSSPVIANNIFFGNGTAILAPSQPNLSIINNIFYGNGLAISMNVAANNILSNLFWQNSTNGPSTIIFNSPGDPNYKWNVSVQDPQLVNVSDSDLTKRDFHLKSTTTSTLAKGDTTAGPNSINSISPPDMGAYGGPLSDTFPLLVSGLSGTSLSSNTVNLTWSLNECYMVKGYNIYYRVDKSGPPYDNATSPIDAKTPASFPYALTVTPPSPPSLSAPTNIVSKPSSGTLEISWDPAPTATGYEVSYKKSTDTTFIVLPLINTSSITLQGLTDPTPSGVPTYYDVSIRPYYQTTYYLAVKDYYEPTVPPAENPKEALLFSKEAIVSIGTPTFGPASTIQDFPEKITPHPNLPNNGCFIATAAYGSYSLSQVQALREFRDRYLLNNGPGRAFVRWYYTYGPRGAQILNDHPEWKPLVRAALLPAVGIALFLTHTSSLTKILFIMIFSASIVLVLHRKKLPPYGGIQ